MQNIPDYLPTPSLSCVESVERGCCRALLLEGLAVQFGIPAFWSGTLRLKDQPLARGCLGSLLLSFPGWPFERKRVCNRKSVTPGGPCLPFLRTLKRKSTRLQGPSALKFREDTRRSQTSIAHEGKQPVSVVFCIKFPQGSSPSNQYLRFLAAQNIP